MISGIMRMQKIIGKSTIINEGEYTMFKNLVAIVCTILSFFFSSAVVALFHLPPLTILLFLPIFVILIALFLDNHHFYD